MNLQEHETILMEISSISIGKIPQSYCEFGDLIWKVFHLGERYKKLMIDQQAINNEKEIQTDSMFYM